MPQPFPHRYHASLEWKGERTASLSAASQPAITGGPPPQFDGSGAVWSPEELLLSSVQLCLMTTFFSLVGRHKLVIHSYVSKVEGVLDKTAEGLRFTSITLKVDLGSDDPARAREVLMAAKKYCIISNALSVPVELA